MYNNNINNNNKENNSNYNNRNNNKDITGNNNKIKNRRKNNMMRIKIGITINIATGFIITISTIQITKLKRTITSGLNVVGKWGRQTN
jgi:hypothetical protein